MRDCLYGRRLSNSMSRPGIPFMIRLSRWTLVASAAVSLVACDDDPPTSSGPHDTTPPAIAQVTPVDVYHVEVLFDEAVKPASAEMGSHYDVAAPGVPDADIVVIAAVLGDDGKTVSLTTNESMSGLGLNLTVNGVTDLSGNAATNAKMGFTGSRLLDTDPPHIVRSTPASEATGVPIGTSILVRFSESIDDNWFAENVNVTWTSPTGPVQFYRSYGYNWSGWNPTFTLVTWDLLDYDAQQTISFSGVRDISGNIMPDASISFRTTEVPDDTPPALVSSYPRDGATHVRVDTDISFTFSEPINRFDFDFEYGPDIYFDYGDWTWSEDLRTVTFGMRDDLPLTRNRQYRILFYPNGVYDLGGRTLEEFQTITFSTGGDLESASVEGRVTGHPATAASDPTGAVVIAETWFSETFGVAMVDEDGQYELTHMEWGPYYVRGYLDTNDDGVISIYTGDALGGYGADLAAGDLELESVPVPESRHVNDINFSIYDPSAVTGTVLFTGELPRYRPIGIGLFSTSTDATNLTNPVATYEGRWPYDVEWIFNGLWDGFEDGDYYLAAYIDADSSLAYEPGIDPSGVYGGNTPTVLHLVNGADYFDIVLAVDYAPAIRSQRVTWPQRTRSAELQRLQDLFTKRDPNSFYINSGKTARPQSGAPR